MLINIIEFYSVHPMKQKLAFQSCTKKVTGNFNFQEGLPKDPLTFKSKSSCMFLFS